jgi:hypothetical protein
MRFLLLACACLVAITVAVDSQEISPRTRAVLELDHQYDLLLRNQSMNSVEGKEEAIQPIKQNINYNYATATQLFWHSVTAYCTDNINLSSWTCASCKKFGSFKVTQIMDDTTNQGYVGWFTQGLAGSPIPGSPVGAHEPFVVVSFRGTVPSKIADWIEDLNFSKFAAFSSKYPSVSVHSGFWGAYMEMKPKMLAGLALAFSDSGARTLIVTGHSLGAAMAELAALDLKLNVYPDKYYASYTQGTPRPGNPAFASLYTSKIDASFREIHYKDLVPHLPPKLLGFQHGPTEVWFQEPFTTYKVCSGTNGEDSSCSDSLWVPDSIADHLTYRGVGVGTFCSKQGGEEQEIPQAKEMKEEQNVDETNRIREQ